MPKINHRTILNSGSAILLANDLLQIVAQDGPMLLELITEGGGGEARWDDNHRKLTLVDFGHEQGSFMSLASPTGGWSLRLAIQVIGRQGTATAAYVVNWQMLER